MRKEDQRESAQRSKKNEGHGGLEQGYGPGDYHRHALDRFVKRYVPPDGARALETVERVFEMLRESFGRAKNVILDPVTTVRRLITNGFEEATYWEDEELKLRYVVSKRQAIVTVERTDEPRRTPQPHQRSRRYQGRRRRRAEEFV